MSRHLADHHRTQTGARLKHYLRIARSDGDAVWQGLRKKPQDMAAQNRRVVEYLRIARGRTA